jgi:nicotinamide mononucleotide transporter
MEASPLEIAANAVTALCIFLAARNNLYTWPVGLVGCALFGLLFFQTQLYADATLQVFFIATGVIGWWQWTHESGRVASRPITPTSVRSIMWMLAAAAAVTVLYGALLHRFTNAYLPYVDAAVLALSVVAQCLLMQRKSATWPVWVAVNTLSVGLFASRGLYLTAGLYACYWFNAWYGWWLWRREAAGAAHSA